MSYEGRSQNHCVFAVTVGFAYRECIENDQWGSWNVSECQTVEIKRLQKRIKVLRAISQRLVSTEIDRTQIIRIQDLQDIASQLLDVIDISQPVFPRDLYLIVDILDDLTS